MRVDMQRLCSMVALLVVLAPWIVGPVGGKLAARSLLLSPGVWLPSQINGSSSNPSICFPPPLPSCLWKHPTKMVMLTVSGNHVYCLGDKLMNEEQILWPRNITRGSPKRQKTHAE